MSAIDSNKVTAVRRPRDRRDSWLVDMALVPFRLHKLSTSEREESGKSIKEDERKGAKVDNAYNSTV
jgi:hypothetical protein